MAQVISGNQVKLSDGKVIQAQQGGWYDGQQFWNGTLSAPGVINSQSNQQGAGQAVSQEVIAQTNPNNVNYINEQRKKQGLPPSPSVNQPQPTPQPTSPGSAGGGGGVGFQAPETINLPQIYETLYRDSGIREIEAELNQKVLDANAQVAKIKDNPYLSEGTMTGRIAKLEEKAFKDQQALRNQIAMKKADIETQLNLQTKQFDINSQATQLAWQQFQGLLESGALENATGEDIANITRSTGLSSSMIQSAIDFSKKKNAPKLDITTFDDGQNTYAVAIDESGNVVNRQLIGTSQKTGDRSGDGLTPTQQRNATSVSRKAIQEVDTNEDKRLSIQEYQKALEKIMASTGVDFATADDYATQAFIDLSYVKWGKGW